jgi:hypothetical protein
MVVIEGSFVVAVKVTGCPTLSVFEEIERVIEGVVVEVVEVVLVEVVEVVVVVVVEEVDVGGVCLLCASLAR